jgi:hypothetical protein
VEASSHPPTAAWDAMDWIITLSLLAIAFACAYVPVLMD